MTQNNTKMNWKIRIILFLLGTWFIGSGLYIADSFESPYTRTSMLIFPMIGIILCFIGGLGNK